MKTYLNVPFALKGEVKALGARWDPARKAWFVPDGMDLYPFLHFLPAEADCEVLSPELERALKRRKWEIEGR